MITRIFSFAYLSIAALRVKNYSFCSSMGIHLSIEDEIRQEFGVVPHVFQYELGDSMYFVNWPRQAWGDNYYSQHPSPDLAFLVIRESDLPFQNIQASYQTTVEGYRVLGIDRNQMKRAYLSDQKEIGWETIGFDVSDWREVYLPHEICMGSDNSNSCDRIDDYTDFFIRVPFNSSPQGKELLVLQLDGNGHKIDRVYVNGKEIYTLNWSGLGFKDGRQILLEVTPYLREGKNLLAIKAGIDPRVNTALTNNLMFNMLAIQESWSLRKQSSKFVEIIESDE